MKTWVFVALTALAVACGGAASPPADSGMPEPAAPDAGTPDAGMIERLDAAFDALVPTDAVIEHLVGGFEFTEGPTWVEAGRPFLVFSDMRASELHKVTPDGEATNLRGSMLSGEERELFAPNGVTVDAAGRVVFCERGLGGRRISRIEADGSLSVVVDNYNGRKLNAPNDLVYGSDGSLYFTDPGQGGSVQGVDELDFSGVYRLAPDGVLHLLVRDMTLPNGLALSPDETRLYVANSSPRTMWMVYELGADEEGPLDDNGRVFREVVDSDEEGVADGLKVDERGNLWATGPGGVWVMTPEGQHLGTIKTREWPTNLAWGDADRQGLYITAQSSIYRLRVSVAGAGF